MVNTHDDLVLVLDRAQTRAIQEGASLVDCRHLLIAILSNSESEFVRKLMFSFRIKLPEYPGAIFGKNKVLSLNTRAESVVGQAVSNCHLKWRHESPKDIHLFEALILNGDDDVVQYLAQSGADLQAIRTQVDIWLKLIQPISVNTAMPLSESVSAAEPAEPVSSPAEKEAIKSVRTQLIDWFDRDAIKLITNATMSAAPSGEAIEVDVDHLVLALSTTSNSLAFEALRQIDPVWGTNIPQGEVSKSGLPAEGTGQQVFSSDLQKVLTIAFREAHQEGAKRVDSGHILVALAKAITDNEIKTQFDAYSSICEIAQFRERIASIRSVFNKPEAPSAPTGYRVFDPEDVWKFPDSFEPIPVSLSIYSILGYAAEEAQALGHESLNWAHLTLGLMGEAVKSHNLVWEEHRAKFHASRGSFTELAEELNLECDDSARKQCEVIMQLSWNIAKEFKSFQVEFNHLCLAVIVYGGDLFKSKWEETGGSIRLELLQRKLQSCAVRQAAQSASTVPDSMLDKDRLDSYIKADISPTNRSINTPLELVKLLSKSSKEVLGSASYYARESSRHTIDAELLLLGLGVNYRTTANRALTAVGFDATSQTLNKRGKRRTSSSVDLSDSAWSIMNDAIEIARAGGFRFTEPEHILLALINECNGYARLAFETYNIDVEDLNATLLDLMEQEKQLG